MANNEQLAILKQGVEAWNKWRDRNLGVRIDLEEANFRYENLSGVNFFGANLRKSDFRNADLRAADLSETDLAGAYFRGAYLVDAQISSATIFETDLSRARLGSVNLTASVIRNANLCEAGLIGAHLVRTVIDQVILTSCDFSNARCLNTFFTNLDLSEAIGLDTVEHGGPSTIGFDTIAKSKGLISEHFLRGCGLSDKDIEFAKLADPGLDPKRMAEITDKINRLSSGWNNRYYSCFISYSSKDHEFAQGIYNGLQENGVRCWFAPEDMKIGDQIRPRIDQEIRLQDKLLIILSENSIKSEWVGDEVEAALEEESKNNRLVLFPIRLDDSVISTRDDWAAKIKRRRHIGDFSNWKDKASYQKAFERLLRDLKATGGEVHGE